MKRIILLMAVLGILCSSICMTTFAKGESLSDINTNDDEITVENADELKAAIGSNRRIIIKDGIYEVTKELLISQAESLTLEAEHEGMVEILVVPISDYTTAGAALRIVKCSEITVKGCILGHKESAYCSAPVINLYDSENIKIENCDLFGCGVNGVMYSSVKNLNVDNCVIRDCQQSAILGDSGIGGNGGNFTDCIISGHGDDTWAISQKASMLRLSISANISNCLIFNNYNFTLESEKGRAAFKNCRFYDNAWDNKTPKAYGICLNGITWQVEEDILKIGYPLIMEDGTVIESAKGKILNYSDSSLPWKKYSYKKVSIAEGVWGDNINSDIDNSDTEDSTHIPANTNIQLIAVMTKYNTLQLNWEPVAGAKTYEVYYSTSPDLSDARRLAKSKKTSCKFSKAVCGQTYYFQVTAYQKSGKTMTVSAVSPIVEGTTHLDGDVNLAAPKTAYNKVNLKWSKVKGAKSYEIYRASSDGNYDYLTTVKSTKYIDKSVQTGENYQYYVKAVSDGYLDEKESGRVSAYPALTKKPKLKVNSSGPDSMRLSWGKVPGADYYKIYRLNTTNGSYECIETVNALLTVYLDKGLNASTQYSYKVEAWAGLSMQESKTAGNVTKAAVQ